MFLFKKKGGRLSDYVTPKVRLFLYSIVTIRAAAIAAKYLAQAGPARS